MNPNALTPSAPFSIAFRELMKGVNVAIPGHFLAFTNQDLQRAQIQVGVQRVDVNGASFSVPPIIDVPVSFPGGNFTLEYQMDPGTEGLIIFSQRCVDGWKQTGGIAVNPIGRFFELQDAFFIPGFRSSATSIQGFTNDGIRLRNASGDQFAWLKSDGSVLVENSNGHIRIASDGTVTINGVIFDTSGNVTTSAQVTAEIVHGTTDVRFANISGVAHRHGGVEAGPDISGGPVN